MALNMLKKEKAAKSGLHANPFQVALDGKYLLKVISILSNCCTSVILENPVRIVLMMLKWALAFCSTGYTEPSLRELSKREDNTDAIR